METLFLQGTEDTPGVKLDYSSGEFTFSGRSLPEDVNTFYQPVLDWIDRFGAQPRPNSSFDFKLEYFNTASSKILLDVLLKLEDIRKQHNCELTVKWFFMEHDEDMLEAGEEYKELVEVPFELIAY
jgi:hypothetical protein